MTTENLETAGTSTDSGNQGATTPDAGTTAAPEAGQPGTQATAGADTSAQAEGDAAQAPADYEPFQLPEGFTADEELLGEFKELGKKHKLTQDQMQELAGLQAKAFAKHQEAMRQAQAQWVEATKTDKEFGGDALNENLGVAKKALDAFASPDLRKLLNDSGLGNHPEVIRTFVRVGKAISEDGRVVSGSKAGAPADPAKRLFPNQA